MSGTILSTLYVLTHLILQQMERNQSTESIINFIRVTQTRNGKAGIQTQAVCLQSPYSAKPPLS